MKVLLTGSKGMLAKAFLNQMSKNWDLKAVDIDELDITDCSAVQECVRSFKPTLIINCAAFTQVDACEEKKEQAFAVNGAGVGYLAEAASKAGALLIHFSTDYVFDGSSDLPYKEDDTVRPINVYGASKWDGECQIRKHLKNHLIVRTQWLYGEGGSHFVNTIRQLAQTKKQIKVVDDQTGAPTWTEDLVKGVLSLIQQEATGTYHVVNSGACSWYDFAVRITEEMGLSLKVSPCTTAEFPRPARRPAHSVLSTEKMRGKIAYSLPSWETALKEFLCSNIGAKIV